MGLLSAEKFETGCRIEIEQSADHFHAHVELDGNIPIFPGDRVQVHGDPVTISFGDKVVFERSVTVQRAGLVRRSWTKFAGLLEIAELYEVSFTQGKLL